MYITTTRKLHTSTLFAVSDNIQKMLYTDSVQKVHKKESHMHDSSNSFITVIIKECKYTFQFLRDEMEPIRMSSHTAAGIICNTESHEQRVITRGGNQKCKESTIISDNVTSTRLCYNASKVSAQLQSKKVGAQQTAFRKKIHLQNTKSEWLI